MDCQGEPRVLGVVNECGGTPRRDQGTPGDENEVFHALDAQSYLLRPVEPANHIVSDVVLENPCADDIFAVGIVRKRQKSSRSPALICDTFGTAMMSIKLQPSGQDCNSLAGLTS